MTAARPTPGAPADGRRVAGGSCVVTVERLSGQTNTVNTVSWGELPAWSSVKQLLRSQATLRLERTGGQFTAVGPESVSVAMGVGKSNRELEMPALVQTPRISRALVKVGGVASRLIVTVWVVVPPAEVTVQV